MNAAELLVRALEREGVEFIFGLPGEENLHFLEAIGTRREAGLEFPAGATAGRRVSRIDSA